MPNPRPLQGKVALVTGGAKRLGKASALTLAEAGADVAITFLNSSAEAKQTAHKIEKTGSRSLATSCDVTDRASVRDAIKTIMKEFGRLDILVNNAGAYETVDFENLTLEQWDSIFATNVRGPFLLSKEAIPHLRRAQGRIVNLGSLGAVRPWPTHAHYCSSKAA